MIRVSTYTVAVIAGFALIMGLCGFAQAQSKSAMRPASTCHLFFNYYFRGPGINDFNPGIKNEGAGQNVSVTDDGNNTSQTCYTNGDSEYTGYTQLVSGDKNCLEWHDGNVREAGCSDTILSEQWKQIWSDTYSGWQIQNYYYLQVNDTAGCAWALNANGLKPGVTLVDCSGVTDGRDEWQPNIIDIM
jgi:hypothetical protein